MTAVAVALSIQENPEVISYPVPRSIDNGDATRLFKRAALISVGLHLLLAAIGLAINTWPQNGVVGTPQELIIDATIVPLSALDTVLPKGAISPDLPTPVKSLTPLQEPPKVSAIPAPLKKDEVKTASAAKEREDKSARKIVESRSQVTKDSSAKENSEPSGSNDSKQMHSSNSSQIGVPNGEAISLEQARISYQDMVATMLARAKRYPERALKRRMTGEGSIRIEIAHDGSVAGFQIVRSTDAPILDDELRAMVDRAAPFPSFPSDLRKRSLALIVPIAFRLDS